VPAPEEAGKKSAVNVAEIQQGGGELARDFRELDARIQAMDGTILILKVLQ
jgi:hypothetical protein